MGLMQKLLLTLMSIIIIFLFGKTAQALERITFFAQKDANSHERIARKGLLSRQTGAQATVLILHGYGGDRVEVGPLRLMLKKYNIMSFDFRAHGVGRSEQQSTIGHDEVYDVFGAVDFIRGLSGLKDKPIIAFGLSMGAAAAIEAQALDPNLFQAMFLDTPFASSEDIIHKAVDYIKISVGGYDIGQPIRSLLERYALYPWVQKIIIGMLKFVAQVKDIKVDTFIKPIFPIESVKKITVPTFFVVCKSDEKVTVADVMRIYENHQGIKRLMPTGGRHHCDTLFAFPRLYKKVLNQFIKDFLSQNIYQQPRELIIGDGEQESLEFGHG